MLQSKTRWQINDIDIISAEQLAQALDIELFIAQLLLVRGINQPEEARHFLQGTTQLYEPTLMSGVKEAVTRIRQALNNHEKIWIYGDYDADGVTSTALLSRMFAQLHADFQYYIPHRIHEGYGLNSKALDQANAQGITLIVTVDTGISAVDEVAYAKQLGIDIIITDHHEPPHILPAALAVINPKQLECPYPFKQLAGVGVALKLVQALLGEVPESYMELAALGTVADLMPLVGENRYIVKHGLDQLRQTDNPGLRALMEVSGVNVREVTAGHIGFMLAPRINASGRLEAADEAVRLLITEDVDEAKQIAIVLDSLNTERQQIVDDITNEALKMLEERIARQGLPNVIVLGGEHWNPGVIGIVASKILEKYYRPTVILGIDPLTGTAKGSARSIHGFDIYQALTSSEKWLTHYGGHQAAAGMSLEAADIPFLDQALNELAGKWLTAEDFTPVTSVDMRSSLADVSIPLIEQLECFAPFGMGNPSPKFKFKGLRVIDKKYMGKEQQHLKLILGDPQGEGSVHVEAVGFGQGYIYEEISTTAMIDVLGEMSINEWNGIKRPQLIVRDLRIMEPQFFDWRGIRQPMRQILAWLKPRDGNTSRLADGHDYAMIMDSLGEYELLLADWKEVAQIPIWRLEEKGNVEPLNDAARQSVFESAHNLFLYSLPTALESLQQLVRRAQHVQRWYAIFNDDGLGKLAGESSRDWFKKMYVSLRQEASQPINISRLIRRLSERTGLSTFMVSYILDVFAELSFIERIGDGYRISPTPAKKQLSDSFIYRRLLHREHVEQTLLFSSSQQLCHWFRASVDGASGPA